MPEVIVRKCGVCHNPIEIKRNSIDHIIFYKKAYYHHGCFCDIAEKRAKKKIKTAQEWQDALDNISKIERETKSMLEGAWVGDDLIKWLLDHYDISKVPDRVWHILADLKNGKFRNKRCRPISTETILETWKWGQRKLDSIAESNRTNHKGPTDDNARILYDLSIVVSKVPCYLAYKEKQIVAKQEMARVTVDNDVDMSRVGHGKQTSRRDISDISDYIFVE